MTTLAQVVTPVTAIGALVFTGLSLNATQKQIEVAAQGQYTDRYTKAVEQIGQQGDDRLQVRLGGIYALERLSSDSPRDQATIIEVLSAFVRTHNPRPASNLPNTADSCADGLALDSQAVLTVLGRRDTNHDNGTRVNLGKSCLVNADLAAANLSGAHLNGTYLTGADLPGADLVGADLSSAHLPSAHLEGAHMSNANMSDTDLTRAHLGDADLRGANLTRANLRGVDMSDVRHDATTIVEQVKVDAGTVGAWW